MGTEPIPPQSGDEVVSPSEEIHLPGPSYLPAWAALGIAVFLVGLILSWGVAAAGGIVALIALGRWINDSRHELDDLPLDH